MLEVALEMDQNRFIMDSMELAMLVRAVETYVTKERQSIVVHFELSPSSGNCWSMQQQGAKAAGGL